MAKPLKYKTPADLQKTIDGYFQIHGEDDWTISGLALWIGSRQLMNDYAERKDYAEIIEIARLRIESSYEKILKTGKQVTGAIFALKNMGWKDTQVIDATLHDDFRDVTYGKKETMD